jgi:ankyrin repeat protein
MDQLFAIPGPKGSILPSDQVEKLMAVARDGPLDAFMAAWKKFDLNSQVGDEPFLESCNNSSKVPEHAYLDRATLVPHAVRGRTALHIAAANGQLDIVRTICAVKNIEVNIKDKFGCTPLHLASYSLLVDSDLVIQQLMRSESINVNAVSNEGPEQGDQSWGELTPLHLAVMGNVSPNVKMLLEEGVGKYGNVTIDVGAKSSLGLTPLHLAITEKQHYRNNKEQNKEATSIIRTLIKFMNSNCPETINKFDEKKSTPLHTSVSNSDCKVVDMLLYESDKINPQILDGEGRSPLDVAIRLPDPRTKIKLQSYLECFGLYGNRDAYISAGNAILVVAALLATVTYVASPIAGSTLYWVFSNFSFFFSISALIAATGASIPSRGSTLSDVRSAINAASVCLAISLSCASGAFITTAFYSVSPGIQHRSTVIATIVIGGFVYLTFFVRFVRRIFNTYFPFLNLYILDIDLSCRQFFGKLIANSGLDFGGFQRWNLQKIEDPEFGDSNSGQLSL